MRDIIIEFGINFSVYPISSFGCYSFLVVLSIFLFLSEVKPSIATSLGNVIPPNFDLNSSSLIHTTLRSSQRSTEGIQWKLNK